MTRSITLTALAVLALGTVFASAVQAYPPCPECFFAYKACLRQGVETEAQCQADYALCKQELCGGNFASLKKATKDNPPVDPVRRASAAPVPALNDGRVAAPR